MNWKTNKVAKAYIWRGLREIWKITEWCDGAIYKTKPAGFVVMDEKHPPFLPEDAQASSLSMHVMQEIVG